MGIWDFIGSTAESVKRNLPDATPVKNACINSCTYGTAAFTKIGQTVATPVKTACRSSYNRGSAAFAKIDHTVRTIGLRRTAGDEINAMYEVKIPAEEVETKRNGLDASPVKNSCTSSRAYGYGFTTFAKIGYTVRVKGVYRIVQWMADDGTKSIISVYAPNDELHESKDGDELIRGEAVAKNECKKSYACGFATFAKIGYVVRVNCLYRIGQWMADDDTKYKTRIYTTKFAENVCLFALQDGSKLIPGQAFAMPMKKECMNSYTFGFITFAKIGYVVRVNVYRVGQWIADDDTKSKISFYSTIFAKNACRYALQDGYKLIPGGVGVAIFIVLSNTLIDVIHEYQKLSKKREGSPQEQFSGDLKDEVGFSAKKEFLVFVVNEFIAFMMKEPFRTQFFCKGVFTMESLVFIMRELLVFTMKRHFGTQFLSRTDEIVVAITRALLGTGFVNDVQFHESTTKKGRKKKGKRN